MARVSAQDCLLQVPNHFALCILAARRARELVHGMPPTVDCDNKAAVTALREIAAGSVSFRESVDEAVRLHIGDRKLIEQDRRLTTTDRRAGPR
jgi:DNA-directed RNA polymerase subunit omega